MYTPDSSLKELTDAFFQIGVAHSVFETDCTSIPAMYDFVNMEVGNLDSATVQDWITAASFHNNSTSKIAHAHMLIYDFFNIYLSEELRYAFLESGLSSLIPASMLFDTFGSTIPEQYLEDAVYHKKFIEKWTKSGAHDGYRREF